MEGPLLLALLHGNNNNNAAAQAENAKIEAAKAEAAKASGSSFSTRAIPDTFSAQTWTLEHHVLDRPLSDKPVLRLRGPPSEATNGHSHGVEKGLSTDELASWHRDGFLVLSNALEADTVRDLMTEIEATATALVAEGSKAKVHTSGHPSPCGRILADVDHSEHRDLER